MYSDDIDKFVNIKRLGGKALKGIGNIPLKTIGGSSIFGSGDIPTGGGGATLKAEQYNTVLDAIGNTEIDNGTELYNKFEDIKTWTPYGNLLAAGNIVTLLVMGGVYDLGSNYLHFDTDFVHIKSLDGNPIHLKTTHTEVIAGLDIRCPVVVDDGMDSYIRDIYCDEEYNVQNTLPSITKPVKSTFKVGDCPNLVVERCFGGLFSFSNTTGNLTSEFNNNTSTGDNCFNGGTNLGTFNNNTSTGNNCFFGFSENSGTFNNNKSTGDSCFNGGTNLGTFNSNIGDGANNFDYQFGGNTGSIAINCQNKGGSINTEKIVNCINGNNQIVNTDFQELKPIYINANTVAYYAPEKMKIDSITDPSSIGTTINVNGVAYTLGNLISELDKIEITSTGTGVVNVVQIYKKHIQ